MHVEVIGDQLSRLANAVKQPFDDIVNDYREKVQSRVTMLMYARAKGEK